MKAKTILGIVAVVAALGAVTILSHIHQMAFAQVNPLAPLLPSLGTAAGSLGGNPGQGALPAGLPPGHAAKPPPEGTCQWPVPAGEGHVICAPN